MFVVPTAAPIFARNITRLASRALLGLARCGAFIYNGTGDYVIAFSANPDCRIPYSSRGRTDSVTAVRNDKMSPLLLAVVEATEEAVLNSLFMATTMEGMDGHRSEALPIGRVLEICRKYNVLNWSETLPLKNN